ncbi:MAG: PhnA domain-containing protein [Sulfurovum sp.]|nr:PhnA domain-containing protein [Sulfurovum sp.]
MSCDLCGNTEDLRAYGVIPKELSISICGVCASTIDSPQDHAKHWNCLHESMWSSVPAVQVVVYRLLHQLLAQDQLDMMYLEDEVKAWAEEGLTVESTEAIVPMRDSNGNILLEGDSVTIIKDLPVKGAGFTAKQGTTVKNIRPTPNDPTHIQGRVNGTMVFLKTAFLKKL